VSTSGPAQAFTANDSTAGYDRWEVMNPSWGANLQEFAAGKWGKFVNSTYAFQVWEPCDQDKIIKACDVYAGVGVRHDQGFRFAINIDVAQFEVYASDATGRGLNEALGELPSSALVHVDGSRFVVTHEAAEGDGRAVFVFVSDEKPSKSDTRRSGSNNAITLKSPSEVTRRLRNASDTAVSVTSSPAPLPGWNSSDGLPTSLSSFGCDAGLFVATNSVSGTSAIYQTTSDSTGVVLVGRRPAGKGQGPAAAVLTATCGSGAEGSSLLLSNKLVATADTTSAPSDDCGLWVALRDHTFNQVGKRSCVAPSMASVDLANVTIAAAAETSDGNATASGVDVVVLLGINNVIHCAVARFTTSGDVVSTHVARPLDVGSSPSITVARAVDSAGGTAVFAAVVEGGYCFNTEQRNKDSGTASCDQQPLAQGTGVSYTVGTLDQWLMELDTLPPSGALSSCTSYVLHGTLTQGYTPR
jgi:hypothetical protein